MISHQVSKYDRSWIRATCKLGFLSFLGMFVALTVSGASAQAATSTANLSVQITIGASCIVNAATLNFGASVNGITMSTTPATATAPISVTCTSGTPFSLGMDNGTNYSTVRRMKNGTNFINYGLYLDAAFTSPWTTGATASTCTTTGQCSLGTGTGSAQTITVYGQAPATTTAPPAGTYTDTVLMTVTY